MGEFTFIKDELCSVCQDFALNLLTKLFLTFDVRNVLTLAFHFV